MAQRPGRAGHAWVFLQYLLGFRRLGYEVLFLDRLTEDMTVGHDGHQSASRYRTNVDWLTSVMSTAGLHGRYSLRLPGGVTVGLDRSEVMRRVRRSSFLLDVNGFLDDEEIAAATPQRVFLDIDPGFNQMWQELGLADVLDGYDAYVTLAPRIGQPDCRIPTCGLSWISTVPPVVLEAWPVAPPTPAGAFTSVATWRGPFDPIEFRGERYGLRVHEFRRLASVAANSDERFALALDIDIADHADADTLTRDGLAARRPGGGLLQPGGLPGLHPRLEGRVRGRQGDVRQDSQRLDQRPERLLPGQRSTRRGAGHRAAGIPR